MRKIAAPLGLLGPAMMGVRPVDGDRGESDGGRGRAPAQRDTRRSAALRAVRDAAPDGEWAFVFTPIPEELREARRRGWVTLAGSDRVRVTVTDAGRDALRETGGG